MKAILLFSILLSASLVLDRTSYNLTQREEEVKEIGVVALEDGMVKKNGKYGFPATMTYSSDGDALFSSASGEVYIYSEKEDVRAGDSLSCRGAFSSPAFFIADEVIPSSSSPFREMRKKAEAFIRSRLSPLQSSDAENLSLMLLLALSDDGESLISSLSREKGVSHVFALSGMHLSVISSFFLPFISLVLGDGSARKVVLVPLFIFTFLSGFRASLLRALIFRILFTFFPDSDKESIFSLTFIIHAAIFKRGDNRTVYNVIYRDGRNGYMYAKRFTVPSIIRDRWYDLTKGTPESQVFWFSANPNGEAETVKIYLRPRLKLKKLIMDYNFSTLAIKGRGSMGNIVTKHPVQKILLRSAGVSTIEGKQMWFDHDIDRLNEDGRGKLLGEFRGDEHILAICRDGSFYTTGLDLSTRFQGDLLTVEKYDPEKVFTAIYWDKTSGYYYIKRFTLELSDNTAQYFIPAEDGARLIAVSEDPWPTVRIEFIPTGNRPKEPTVIDAEEFIGVKGFRAKGKRAGEKISTIAFGDPLHKDTTGPEQAPLDLEPDRTSEYEDSGSGNIKAGESIDLIPDYGEENIHGDESQDNEPTLF